MRKQNIIEENWDWLIVLDACRYDMFEEYYDGYLDGYLEKRWSYGSNTAEWLARNFTDYYDDIEYISANPFINEENTPLNKLVPEERDLFKNWHPKQTFRRIHNIALGDWFGEKQANFVQPEDVLKYCIDARLCKDTRKIIHFVQPHEPYLDSSEFNKFRWILREFNSMIKEHLGSEVCDKLKTISLGLFGNVWFDMFRKCYIYNLRRVLNVVSILLNVIEGKVIITADHGELLGEHDMVGHPSMNCHILRTVPWFEVRE